MLRSIIQSTLKIREIFYNTKSKPLRDVHFKTKSFFTIRVLKFCKIRTVHVEPGIQLFNVNETIFCTVKKELIVQKNF